MRTERMSDGKMCIRDSSTFVTLDQFVNAVMADTVNTSTMQRLEGQCANDLFDWEITEVEVIETN